ncbi:MAG: hypothetical protein EBU70_08590 [Actinobacteria bacterium]|nr:hypothetical protein [Actinomycetota bacterium]
MPSDPEGWYQSWSHGIVPFGSFDGSPLRKRSTITWYQTASLAQSGVRNAAFVGSSEYVLGSRSMVVPSRSVKV